MTIDKEVNSVLNEMHDNRGADKGTPGELAVIKVCEEFYQMYGGILYHSFEYKVDRDLAGNIKKNEDGKFFIENLGNITEIDVLLITPYRIFPIEVKAYRANKITLTDEGIDGTFKTDKSPIHQNEMHCRHFYSHIFKNLPNGSTEYIVPIVCFVDKAQLIDNRSEWQKNYIKACTLNQLRELLIAKNVPGEYILDLIGLDRVLKECSTDHEKYYPVRM